MTTTILPIAARHHAAEALRAWRERRAHLRAVRALNARGRGREGLSAHLLADMGLAPPALRRRPATIITPF